MSNELDFNNVDWDSFGQTEQDTAVPNIDIPDIAKPTPSAVMSQATKENPDEYAKINQLSRETGIPAESIKPDIRGVESTLKFQQFDFTGMKSSNPHTHDFISNYDNAAVVQNDVSMLQRIEDTLRSIPGGAVKSLGSAFEGAARGIQAGGRLTGNLLDVVLPDEIMEYVRAPAPDALDLTGLIQRQGQLLQYQGGEIADVPEERKNLATDIGEGLGQVATQIVTTILNPATAVGMMFSQGVQQQGERQEATDTEGTTVASDLALLGGGAITAATEKLGIDALLNRVPPAIKNKFIRQIADVSLAGGVEAVQEVIEGVAQGLLEQATTNPDAEIFEGLDREAMAAGGVGAITRGIINMLTPGRARIADTHTEQTITQGEIENAIVQKLNNDAVATEVKTRDPQTLKNFVEGATAEDTNIFIDGDQVVAYMQDKTPNEIENSEALKMFREQINEAQALGGDVVVSTGDFVEKIAGTPEYEALKSHMTLSAESVSPAKQEQSQEATRQYASSIMEQAKENVSQYVDAQEIFNTVKDQLIDSGAMDARSANVAAQIVPAWATVYARDNNMTIKEAYEASGLTIEGPQTGRRAELEGELELLKQAENEQAVSKGLDMSAKARKQRALDMGFDVDRTLYHWTNADFDRFELPESDPFDFSKYGPGIYLSPDKKYGEQFTDGGDVGLNVIPTFINAKLAQEDDVRLALNEVGQIRGHRKTWEAVQDNLKNKGFGGLQSGPEVVVFDPKNVRSVNAAFDPEFKESSDLLKQTTNETARGYFDPNNSIIRLTEASDLSTFLHEFAHFMYQMELNGDSDTAGKIQTWFQRNSADVAAEANRYLPDDRKFIDTVSSEDVTNFINNKTTGNDTKDGALRVATHEQFARGFETYLMEGKAPSMELREVFRTFARWLTQIYRSIQGNLNVTLDNEIREVMDRMLATDEQIQIAEARNQYEPMFRDQEQSGMTEKEFEAYEDQQVKVENVQQETLRDKLVKEITRTRKKEWNDELQEVTDKEIERLKTERVYVTREQLRSPNGEIKLDLAATKDMAGVEATDKRGRKSFRLPGMLSRMTKSGGEGIHPDDAAAIFGYSSGSEMLNDLIETSNIKEAAKENAEQIMKGKYGDIFNDGSIEIEAEEAVRNEERGKLLLTELKALRRGTSLPVLERQAMKDVAKETIAKMSYRDIHPAKYRKAELQAAQESAAALERGDKVAAASAKARQVLNYYLGMEATAARANTDKIVSNMSRYNKKNVRTEIMKNDKGYMEQIDKILARFDFRKSASLTQVAEYNEGVETWMKNRIEEDGDELVISPVVLNEMYRTHWKNVPYGELQGIRDSVRNIEHVARYGNKMDYLDDKVQYEKLVTDWLTHLNKQPDAFTPQRTTTIEDTTKWGAVKKFARSGMAQMTKIPFMASWLDGGERVGMSHDIMIRNLNDAYKQEQDLWSDIGNVVLETIKNRSPDDIKRHMRVINIPEIASAVNDGNLRGDQVLAVALNTGNPENLRKMLLGEGWADPEVESEISFDNPKLQAVLQHMTESDWKLVQLVWTQMDKLYPKLAEVHRRTTGVEPPKVEASPVQTPFGELEGGYYPMVYDHNRSGTAAQHKDRADAQTESMFSTDMSLRARVTASSTNERTGYYGPVNLNLDVIPNHFQETIHYITHHDPVRQLNKLVTDPRVRETIVSKLGPEEYAQLKPWLNDIAKEGRGAPPKTFIDSIFGHLRTGVTLGVMGFKASTGLIQLSGIFNTMAEVPNKHVYKAMRTVYSRGLSSMQDASGFAIEHSKIMETRINTMDREIRTAMMELNRKKSKTRTLQEVSMKHIALIQYYGADLISWHAAYESKLEETGDLDKAYEYADWVVENVQGSGTTRNMATLMRNQSKTMSTFTMFMTFFSSLWNMERDLVRGAKSKRYSATSLAAKSMFLFTLPVLFEMLLRGEVTADEEDEEKAQKVLTNLALYPIASVPFVRDIASGTLSQYGYNASPVASLLETGIAGGKGAFKNVMEGDDITMSQAKNVTKLGGAILQVPGVSQAWATGEHLYDVLKEGEELTFGQLIFGPDKD